MSDWIVEIQRLGELRGAGLLTEGEFAQQKALVLPSQQDLPEPPRTGYFPCDPHGAPDCSECFETFEWTWTCIEANCGSCALCLAVVAANARTLLTDGSDLRGADLAGMDFSHSYMQRLDLSGANLSGADLSHTKLFGANLAGADLSEANLVGADLTQANLAGANLTGADLSQAMLYGASLAEADLSGATIDQKIPSGVNLTGVIGYNP
jgi:hypothetical protein